MPTPGENPVHKTLSPHTVMSLSGLRGVDPSALFGIDMEPQDIDILPPHARSYYYIGEALQGTVLDSWGPRSRMCRHFRAPHFKDFEAVTHGLSQDDKVRFFMILDKYLRDIMTRMDDFKGKTFEIEVLQNARLWVEDMFDTVDEATKKAFIRLGLCEIDDRDEPLDGAEAEATGRTQIGIRETLAEFFEKLRGIPTDN